MTKTQPEQRQPPAAWLGLRYSKLGPARFTSARDIARLMERALKRAGVPVAYSSGFNPHQRVSYAFPAPTGAASQAEYVLIGLTAAGEATELQARLNAELPAGVRAEAAGLTPERHLLQDLAASRWRIDWPSASAASFDDDLAAAVADFLARDTVLVERRAKSGVSQQDVCVAVAALAVTAPGQAEMTPEGPSASPALLATLRQGSPLIRPGDLLAGLAACRPELAGHGPGLLTRLAQGSLCPDGTVVNLL